MFLRAKNFFITFLIAAVVFTGLAIVGIQFATGALFTGNNNEPDDNGPLDTREPDNGPGLTDDNTTFSFVLIGTDYQPNIFDDYRRPPGNTELIRPRRIHAASIIYVRMIRSTNEVLIIPIPPTTTVMVAGVPMPIAVAYNYTDAEFISYMVSYLVGLPVDFWASTNFAGFASIIDTLGGINFTVPRDMNYTCEESGFRINLRSGSQRLSGDAAMQMLRYPNHADHTAHMNLTIEFLQRVFRDTATLANLARVSTLFNDLLRFTDTNITLADLMANVDLVFAYNRMEDRVIHVPGTFAADGTFTRNATESRRIFAQFR